MAADSRLSDADGLLIDEGMKLFEVPITCRSPGPGGFFDQPFVSRSVGMVAVGGSLVFQHVYGTMVTMLGSLVGQSGSGPTNADVAQFPARLTTIYVRRLGVFRPKNADLVGIAIGGISRAGEVEAFELVRRRMTDGSIEFVAERLDTSPGQVHFMGDQVGQARKACEEVELQDQPGAPKERAALNVIESFIEDPSIDSIGGEVQVGHTVGFSFRRMFSVRPLEMGKPQARMGLNAIDLAEISSVGPCQIAPMGMVTP